MVESLILNRPANAPRAQVVYLRQCEESRKQKTWQRRRVWKSWVAPLHVFRSLVYWDLEPFADVVVTVERDAASGQLLATAKPGRRWRPLWVRYLFTYAHWHSVCIVTACAVWIVWGWPRADTPVVAGYVARVLMAFLLVVVNAIIY